MRQLHKGARQRLELKLRNKRLAEYEEEIAKIERGLKKLEDKDAMRTYNRLRFLKKKVDRISRL